MTDHILAIDQGTTSSRAILFDAELRPVATGQQEFRQIFPHSGWVEHDPEEIWSTTIAMCREAVEKAGVAKKIELRIAPAAETLRALPEERVIDLSFIDADKTGYPVYYEELLKRTRPGGVILVDNVLWGGRVADPSADHPDTQAIRAFNDAVTSDARVDCVMLAISDGLTLLRVRD